MNTSDDYEFEHIDCVLRTSKDGPLRDGPFLQSALFYDSNSNTLSGVTYDKIPLTDSGHPNFHFSTPCSDKLRELVASGKTEIEIEGIVREHFTNYVNYCLDKYVHIGWWHSTYIFYSIKYRGVFIIPWHVITPEYVVRYRISDYLGGSIVHEKTYPDPRTAAIDIIDDLGRSRS